MLFLFGLAQVPAAAATTTARFSLEQMTIS